MVEIEREVRTAGNYWSEMVEPDYQDHLADLASLRRAWHSAVSLFHMADWVFHSHEASVRAAFQYRDKKGSVQSVSDPAAFANSLEQQNDDFGRIRGIANAAKHLKLKDVRPVEGAPSHAANTRVASTGWGEGPFGKGPFGGTPRVMLEADGGDLEYSDISKSVYDMWQHLNGIYHWW